MIMMRAVMSLYEEAKLRVRVHHGSVLSLLLFAIAVGMVTEAAKEGLMNEILYADDLVLTSDTVENLRKIFRKWN